VNGPRLVVADDSALMRQAIEMALDGQYEIVASVEDGDAAVAAAAKLTPQLILLDISMPGLNGLEAARRIKLAYPVILLIFVSEHDEKSYRQAAFDAGGSGYVTKRKMLSELQPAIHDVLIGKEYGRLTA
jgi:DNA-binding NarL/FixJ family response regulator